MKSEFIRTNKYFQFFLIKIIIYCQIYDNFNRGELENGNYDILDVTGNYNLKLIVTTSKNIYIGIPPTKKTTTNANLINSTSIITINENYLLAVCLQDSLLIKINLNDGTFSSLINYNEINISTPLEIPTSICSLSLKENYTFIGYSIIDYNETNQTNKTIIIIRLELENINNIDQGPNLNLNSEKKFVIFPYSTIKTNSSRQISCEALNIKNNIINYRLVCIYEDLEYDSNYYIFRYRNYATVINANFDGFDVEMYNTKIYRTNITGGFRLYKLNNTNGLFVMRKVLYHIYLEKFSGKIIIGYKQFNKYSFFTEMDLFDYKSNIFFTCEKNDFMNMTDIYFLSIFKFDSNNYYKFYDYQEEYIKRMLCYYDESDFNIIIVYQSINQIKYFYMKLIENIFNFNSTSITIKIKTYESREYNAEELINKFSHIGKLNIEGITRNISGEITTENYGVNFYELLINDNKLILENSFNIWYIYNLSFIEHLEGDYTRIYYLNDVNIIVKTCHSQDCISCWENYDQCDEYGNGAYALLIDDNKKGYPVNKLIKGYIYNDTTKFFEKCYHSCYFCNSSSFDQTSHKCEFCANGYLLSYAHPGNCYKLNNLQSDEEKFTNDYENYIHFSCISNKIYSTGECIDFCPIHTPFYIYEYNYETKEYSKKKNLIPPKYLFNRTCYELCPSDAKIKIDEINNICECKYAFYSDNNKLICYNDDNCIAGYNYQNPDTKECFSSLNDCFEKENNYFFNKLCYKNGCPENTVPLSTKSESIQEYFRINLLLEDNLKNKLCICNTTNKVWTKITSNGQYFQECLNECPEKYISEEITKQCIEITDKFTSLIEMPTIRIETLPTSLIEAIPSSLIEEIPSSLLQRMHLSQIEAMTSSQIEIIANQIGYIPKIEKKINITEKIIIDNIKDGTLNYLLSNVTKDFKNDIIINGKNILYQITSSYNQNYKVYENISSIKLGECENILKDKYNIDRNETLFMFKIDYFLEEFYIPIIKYSYFSPKTYEELDINYCKNATIKMEIPISIDEKDLYKHNPSSDYYNDKCYPNNSEGRTDLTLYDRKIEYNKKNMSLCLIECEFKGYNSETKKAICECGIQNNNTISDFFDSIISNKEEFIHKFLDIKKTANLDIIKCYKLLFSKEGLIFNIGSYILLIILFLFFIFSTIFCFKGFKEINNIINIFIKMKKENKFKININKFKKKRKRRKKKKRSKKFNININNIDINI